MPSLKSSKSLIRQVVCEWYGLLTMPMAIHTREEEQDWYETEHSYINRDMWMFVNHSARLVFRWSKDADIDLVVWNEASGSYRMIQDVCFKDAYPDAIAWNRAVMAIVSDPAAEVWVVSHRDAVSPPSIPEPQS